jgi:hypothetical protein
MGIFDAYCDCFRTLPAAQSEQVCLTAGGEVRIVTFTPPSGGRKYVSADIADDLRRRCDLADQDIRVVTAYCDASYQRIFRICDGEKERPQPRGQGVGPVCAAGAAWGSSSGAVRLILAACSQTLLWPVLILRVAYFGKHQPGLLICIRSERN